MAKKIKPRLTTLNAPDYVPLFKLRKFIENQKDVPGSTKLTFEFMMTLCFPTIYESISRWGAQQYINGYHYGERDALDESSRSSI